MFEFSFLSYSSLNEIEDSDLISLPIGRESHERTEEERYTDPERLPDLPQLPQTPRGIGGENPAEVCGIKLEGGNKWLTIIQNAYVPTCNTKNQES